MSTPASPRCRHEWSPDYVCTECARVRLAAEPYWARVYPWPGRKRGPRAVWLALWTCADTDTREPAPVFGGNKLLAERSGGITTRAVQAYLERLQELGWIRKVDGDHARDFELAWGEPRADWGAQFIMEREQLSMSSCSPTMNNSTPTANSCSPKHEQLDTHTCVGLGFDIPVDLADDDAGARPDTPTLDRCGLCTVSAHARTRHPDCERHEHRDPGDLPRTPAPEEHTHGKKRADPAPTDARGGQGDRPQVPRPRRPVSPGPKNRDQDLAHGAGLRPDRARPMDGVGRLTREHTHDDTPRQDSARTHTREPSPPPMAEFRAHDIEPSNDAATPHTHGDTPEKTELDNRDRAPAARTPGHPAQAAVRVPGLAAHAASIRAGHDPRGDGAADATPGHAPDRRGAQGGARTLAHASPPAGAGRGDGASHGRGDARPVGPGRLTHELVVAVSEAGFDDKHDHASWVKALQETILALKLDVVAVSAILEAWVQAPAGSGAPDRDRIWYRDNRPWIVDQLEAAGLRKAVVLKFAPLTGGAVVDTTPYWAKPGFVPEEEVS